MSSNFSANQYDDTFKRQTMQNWGQTKHVKERPTARLGHTAFIADDKGYLLPGVKRGSSWSDFKGTWDLPARIPLQRPLNPTARTEEGINRLQSWGFYPQNSAWSQPHRGSKSTDILQDAGEQTSEDVQQDVAAPSSAADARLASQNHLVTVGQRAASRSSAAEDQPAPRPVEEAAGQHQHPPSGDL
ncbi:protein Flattop [Amphiprion ocellaris]|uniref:Protein Flattop n=2 Tax=Amphiprion TaxID=80969 RepID=A0AAQ6AAB5_AMPOC|nr:protein Flattop [Amphiprion ocellaris]